MLNQSYDCLINMTGSSETKAIVILFFSMEGVGAKSRENVTTSDGNCGFVSQVVFGSALQ